MPQARPPRIKGAPIIGSLFPMLKNPHQFLINGYKSHGEVYRFNVLNREYIVLAGLDASRFFVGKGKDCFSVDGFWGKAMEFMHCPHMITGVDGDIHQHQRNLMKPLLNPSGFKDQLERLSEPVEKIVLNQTESIIDVGSTLRHIISNQVGFSLQGHNPSYADVNDFIYYFSSVMNVFGLRKWPRFMLSTPRFIKSRKIAQSHAEKVLSIARKENPEHHTKTYLDVMLPELEKHSNWYGKGEIETHALLPFIASLDTVASTLGFLLIRLLKHPNLFSCIQHEVDHYFSNGVPSYEQLIEMQNLNGFIKEIMRVQPTAFAITRTTTQNFNFKDYAIPKGVDVLLFTTADHTNPKYFPNPDEFDIERYKEPRKEHRQPAYAPFGKGSHACIGSGLAELMLPINLGIILYNWDIKPACNLNKVNVIFNPAPVLSDNFKIQISKRSDFRGYGGPGQT